MYLSPRPETTPLMWPHLPGARGGQLYCNVQCNIMNTYIPLHPEDWWRSQRSCAWWLGCIQQTWSWYGWPCSDLDHFDPGWPWHPCFAAVTAGLSPVYSVEKKRRKIYSVLTFTVHCNTGTVSHFATNLTALTIWMCESFIKAKTLDSLLDSNLSFLYQNFIFGDSCKTI